jgi:hypothetical protein
MEESMFFDLLHRIALAMSVKIDVANLSRLGATNAAFIACEYDLNTRLIKSSKCTTNQLFEYFLLTGFPLPERQPYDMI